MSHTESMKEKMARAAVRSAGCRWSEYSKKERQEAMEDIDAILDVLMEPSEGVIEALYKPAVTLIREDGKNYSLQPLEAYKAAIQAIKDNH